MAPRFQSGNLGKQVELTINGKPYTVPEDLPANSTLNSFIRINAHLKGTKFMCLEAGCGACIVNVTSTHPSTGNPHSYAVNSCLVPIYVCHGWDITTVEGLGNKKNGYDKVVTRLAAANGTQCGYCSPGMVMNMYSLLKSNPKITMKEIENSFGGNICRCTGYRPIMDAFKSLASDAPPKLVAKLTDIEDMICSKNGEVCKSGKSCSDSCSKRDAAKYGSFRLDLQEGKTWYRPTTIQEIFEILDMEDGKHTRLVGGNTGHGVYRITEMPDVFIDINGVPELHGSEITADGITLGANINLTEAMELFYRLAKEQPGRFAYCKTLADHIDLIANVPVRNTGTFAGNIAMKHAHREFPTDIFLMLEMVGAQLVIAENSGEESTIGMIEYLQTDMTKKIIKKILLPNLNSAEYHTTSFKIMPRAQNAHAYVNAGFRAKVDKKNKCYVLEKPTVLFGGIDPEFLHAYKTEEYLTGKQLLDEATLKGALQVLASELKPDHVLPDATPEYRKGLAESLFYKFILGLDPEKINEKYRSGGPLLQRPVSTAKQDFDTNQKVWPLNKPVPKIEALIQCSGEAEYTNDTPDIPGQVWAQLVLTDRANAIVSKIDPSEALKIPGVIAFYSAKDIPGRNTFIPKHPNYFEDEIVFVDGRAQYAGQCVGVIVAETLELAIRATQHVKVSYSDQQKVMGEMLEIIENKMNERIKEYAKITPKDQGKDIKHTLSGTIYLKSQYHYTMETQSCVAVPTEDHLEVYSSTQWPSSVQEAISVALNIPENMVDLRVRRLGGGYGAKISRNNHTGVVASLVAHLLHRPCRMVLSLENNTEWTGKRFPVYGKYEVGVNDAGEIQYLNGSIYQDDGHGPNDSAIGGTIHHVKSGYDGSRWNITGYGVKTDNASNTWCRAPGSTEAIAYIETIMEHISNVTGKDPISVRKANFNKADPTIASLMDDLRKQCDYDNRLKDIEDFNQKNRWKKKGISIVPMVYPFQFWGNFYAIVSIYGSDGTVAITHGAIEMGQGVNTKAAQVAGYILGVPLESIAVKPTMSVTSPNNAVTGGSLGSEAVCYAVKVCCEQINERLKPIREELGKDATWAEICYKAMSSNIDLNGKYMFTSKDDVKEYSIYGLGVTEVELDVLTGQYICRRVDLLEDTGESLSPEVDIGQVEGAFVMGLGYFTCEEIVYESSTGRLLTNRTWNYKPPGAKDIPVDFRVELRKNAPNPTGVLRSKATGEPPFCLSNSVLFALRNALEAARKDSGVKEDWFHIDPPLTAEKLWLGCLTKTDSFKL